MSWCYIGSNPNHRCREMRLWQDAATLSCCSRCPSHRAIAVPCLRVTALATLLCQSQGHLIQGDNQLSSCGAQHGYCNVPSPPLVLLLGLGEEQLPDVLEGKDSHQTVLA